MLRILMILFSEDFERRQNKRKEKNSIQFWKNSVATSESKSSPALRILGKENDFQFTESGSWAGAGKIQ